MATHSLADHAHGRASFDSFMDALSPLRYGLPERPAYLLIAVYALIRGDRIAFLERRAFVPDLTGAHFMHMAKAPVNFALRKRDIAQSTQSTTQECCH